ncbi:MAG: TIGR03936 family radical SAM-associated protein, partial [Acidobacteria bacterium]|nr:TIGR03936 family radical SAM-associated protein [Acidobacteriota bacterium]
LERVKEFADSERIEISLPSFRVSSINKELLKSFEKKKKMSFTLAPEAGSERLRRVINKRITDEEILKSAEILFSAGFSSIKLYFIIGLPKETMEDIESIVNLANQIVKIGRNMGVKRLNITVSTSSFVPKPFTPFQWEKVPSKEEIVLKQNYLKKRLKPPINYKWHDIEASLLEAVFSRGDRRLNKVLYEAHLLGCKLDGWAEHFKFDRWLESFNKSGLDFFKMLEEEFKEDDILPWDFIDVGVSKKFFKEEREKAFKEETTDACGEGVCFNCGNLKKICSQIEYTEDDYSLSISERCKNSSIYQYRMLFSKEFPATFIGHLDFVKNIARSFRRSGIEIAYSNGFHPFPQIEVASPLPLGVYGENELMDFVSYSNINGQMVNSLNRNLAQGIRIKEIKKRTKEDLPLNQYTIHNYEVDIGKLSNEKKNIISEMIRKFMEAKDFLIEVKKGSETKSVDLRKKVLNCCMKDEILSIKMVNGGIIKFLETLLKNDEDFLKIKIIRKSVEALPR